MIGSVGNNISSPYIQLHNVVIVLSLLITLLIIYFGQEKVWLINKGKGLGKVSHISIVRNASNVSRSWETNPPLKTIDPIQLNIPEAKKDINTTVDLGINLTTRFVLFLCDATYFPGAVALMGSLSASMYSTKLPPLVMIVGNTTINSSQASILETLGAQVKRLDLPGDLAEALDHLTFRDPRWEGVFSKFLLFKPEIVECDVVFYIDTDAVARGNLMECMNDLLHQFYSNPQLILMAVGDRIYFNNGVMLARPSASTYNYMVSMVRNGTCDTNCSELEAMTKMKRIIKSDQEVVIEYTERFPEKFFPIEKNSPLNLRPLHSPQDRFPQCSIVHYASRPKPWEVLFGQEFQFKELPENKISSSFIQSNVTNHTIPEWALYVWRDYWNGSVRRLNISN